MSQLDRIERLLTELVRDSRDRRLRAERERFEREMDENPDMSADERDSVRKRFTARMLRIGEGYAVIEI